MTQQHTNNATGIRLWSREPSVSEGGTMIPATEITDAYTENGQLQEAGFHACAFFTIPRLVVSKRTGEVLHDGYPVDYADQVARAVRQRFGYALTAGTWRLSQSGHSFVFERQAAVGGAAFDFGLAVPSNGKQAVAS